VAWGPTSETLKPENLLRARRFDEAWHDDAPWCEPEPHDHAHDDHAHSHDDHHHHDHGEIHDRPDHESGPRAA
jgi:zinc/manganese transport system ATP-binding protein